jgi:dihydropyrimidine dehydrogenase (NAD+) subunit PreA
MANGIDLSVDFCGVRFKNPFLLSSSPVSNSAEMVAKSFEAGWSGVVFKTLASGRARIVHPSPRMNAYHYGSKPLMGLQNVEQISDRPLKDNLLDFLYLKKHYPDHPIVASIMGFSMDDWEYLAKASEDNGADMLELNFSCPHMTIEGSGHKVGQAFELLEGFTEAVKRSVKIPVMAKMTPNITDMTEPAYYAKKGGADAISAVNTFRGISEIGLEDWVPKPNVHGIGAESGYSGPAVKPIALHFIADMARSDTLGLPLSGIGGIETWVDCLEYLLVGATTVQVTTGIIHYGYRIVEDMIEGLEEYMRSHSFETLDQIIGKAVPSYSEWGDLDMNYETIAKIDASACIGCQLCMVACHDGAHQCIHPNPDGSRVPVVDEDECVGCNLCQIVCPVEGCITMESVDNGYAPATWNQHVAEGAVLRPKKGAH